MNDTDEITDFFSRTLMAGVFTGIVATFFCLVFDIVFRTAAGFEPSNFINVSTIIFTVPFLLIVEGLIFFGLSKYQHASVSFFTLSVVVTVFLLLVVLRLERSTDAVINSKFKTLLAGIVIISGLSSLSIPYLSSHRSAVI